MRVYLPFTLPALALVSERQEVGPAPLTGYAVTPALREWLGTDDAEELEYEVLNRAARASLRLLALDGLEESVEGRRAVVVAEVGEDGVADTGSGQAAEELGAVRLEHPVPLARIAAFHVDSTDAVRDVRAARAALDAAERGDGEARALVEDVEDHELLWYATQELEYLL